LLGDFRLLAPHDDFVPLRAFLAFTVTIFVSFVCGNRKIRDGLAAAGVTGLGVTAQTADENNFIYGHEMNSPIGVEDSTGRMKKEMSGTNGANPEPFENHKECGTPLITGWLN
jgi:hypothetical protein